MMLFPKHDIEQSYIVSDTALVEMFCGDEAYRKKVLKTKNEEKIKELFFHFIEKKLNSMFVCPSRRRIILIPHQIKLCLKAYDTVSE